MSLPNLVGVTGRARHGKDTVGQLLSSEFGYTRFGFADELKDMALALNPLIPVGRVSQFGDMGWEDGHVTEGLSALVARCGWEAAKGNAEVRRFLIDLGMQARERFGEDAWVNALKLKLSRFEFNYNDPSDRRYIGPPVVITDVRFPNEAAFIRSNGGILLRVKRVVSMPNGGFAQPFDNGLDPNIESERYCDQLDVQAEFVAMDVTTLQGLVRGFMSRLKEGE